MSPHLRRSKSSALALVVGAVLMLLAMAIGAPKADALTLNVSQARPADTTAGAFSTYRIQMAMGGGQVRSLDLNFPAGQLGVVSNATICTVANFQNDNCAASSVVGETTVHVKTDVFGIELDATGKIYRLPATGNEAMRIGMAVGSALSATLYIQGEIRLRNDYGITASIPTIPNKATVTIFGIPTGNTNITIETMDVQMYSRINNGNATANGFFFNPSECTAANMSITAVPYSGASATNGAGYTPTNCAAAPFNPSLAFKPTPSAAATPTEFEVEVSTPFVANGAKMQSPIREAVATLPEGIQLSAQANSDGTLVDCSAAQYNYAVPTAPSSCPSASKVGTISLDSPLVGIVAGDVFLAQPAGGPNDLVQLYAVAQKSAAADAIRIKIRMNVEVDPATGRTIATLVDLPEQPVNVFSFKFRGGNNAGTRQPRLCGTYQGSGALKPFSTTANTNRTADYVVSSNCPSPTNKFDPTVAMTATPSKASAPSTGVTTLALPVGDEPFTQTRVALPAGMIANIQGRTRCSTAQAAADACPAASKVGTVLSKAGQSPVPGQFTGDVFLTDAPDAAAIVGLYIRVPVQVGPIYIDTLKINASLRLRTDFGIDVVSAIPEEVRRLKVDLQELRLTFDGNGTNFLHNPPKCTGNNVSADFTSSLGSTKTSTSAITIEQCAALLFQPSVAFAATPASAGGASGLTTTVTLPQTTTAANAQGVPKRVVATLPDGVSLSSSAGASTGAALTGCTDAQFAKATFAAPTCAATTQVGTTTIQTPSVGTLSGTVYLATSVAGSTGRIFIYANSATFPGKAVVKLEGLLNVNETTGNVTVDIDDIPPAAFTSFVLDMRGGAHPVLAMPRTCGTVSGSVALTPHHSATVNTQSGSINFNQNCADAASFNPTFAATSSSTAAGTSTTLTQTVNVPERHRSLDKLDLSLPGGMLANIAGVPRCSIADANDGACPTASKIGDVSTLAGQGANPKTFAGEMFLTDAPSAGDVVGIAIKIPAVVGPIDLGDVITIASVKLRPADYGIDVSANVPTSVKGVPLYLQQLRLTINRSGFLTNPVTCGASTIGASLRGAGGAAVSRTVPYQATNCAGLGFNPTVAFSANPAQAAGASQFTATITAPVPTEVAPQAALRRAVVDLPTGVSLSPSINSAGTLAGCTAAQFGLTNFTDPTCPAPSSIGTATIQTPSVGTLTGDVYLTSVTPTGAVAGLFLDAKSSTFGASARVKLEGKVDVEEATGKTTATFDNAPAVVFTSFALQMHGGTAPAISVPRTCGTTQGAAALTPQSGSAVNRTGSLVINASCADENSFGATGSVSLGDLRAARDTSMTLSVGVPSGHRELTNIKIKTPAGLLAKIEGKTRCSVASANAGTCAAATQIGTLQARAGQGTTPGTYNGTVYLVDAPTAGDIVGIGMRIPVVAGPVDLGVVNVLASAKLLPDYSLEITAAVPTKIKGIPMYLRGMDVTINKPDFLFNPSECGTRSASVELTSASYAGNSSTVTRNNDLTFTDCATVPFDPQVAFSANPRRAGGAGAFTTRITLPGSSAALDDATVTLPDGVSLSPSINSGGGLVGCTDAQFNLADPQTAPACAGPSDIGEVTIDTPAVGQLTGDVYLAQTAPGGNLARVMVYARSTVYTTARAKFEGLVRANPTTGIVTAEFTDAPPVPFTAMNIEFRGGTNPAISLPRTCGTPQGSAVIKPKSSATTVNRTANLTIDDSCGDAGSFAPTLTTAAAPATAGASTTLTTTIGVPERHRPLDRVTLNLPAGLLAKLDGHALCPIVNANAGTCAAATKIGSARVLAGQGTTPGTFNGELFLTAPPAAGDAAGIAVKVPAVVGPVDLGNVITVGSVRLRPTDYGLTVVADVPTRQQGVDLHMRELRLTIDEAGFMNNAVTCDPLQTTSTLRAAGGTTASPTAAYQATNCAALGFNPSVSFSAAPPRAAGASAFTTRITAPAGTSASPQAALKRAVVDLPTGVSLSSSIDSNDVLVGCTAVQFGAGSNADPTCPAGSEIGNVTLAVPQVGSLVGKLYLAQAAPSGAIAGLYLDAESTTYGVNAIRVKLDGKIDVDAATGKTTATFDNAPAIPFTSLDLALRGGSSPAVSMPRTCGTPQGAAALSPQLGAAVNRTGTLTVNENCGDAAAFAATGNVALSDLRAGQDTNLTTSVAVPSGHRELARMKISLPAGLLAKIDGKTRCTVAAAQAGTCAAATEIGTITAQAGQGTADSFTGKAYLVDAPSTDDIVGIGLSIPVVVGPVDLGKVNVVASVALRSDYGIDITADVPTRIKGIPMYLRNLAVNVNRADFLFNPSSCGAKPASMALTSADYSGATSTANVNTSVTITDCAGVAFNPTVAFSATPKKAGGAGAFTTRITLPASGQSAMEGAAVTLPAGMSLSPSIDSDAALTGCTDAQFGKATPFAAPTCPAASKIGDVALTTNSIGALTGDVYLASTAPSHLARVMVYARSTEYPGARVKFEGVIDVNATTGVTTADFSGAPDVPFTSLEMTFRGGDRPALSLPRTCGSPQGSAVLRSHAGTNATRNANLLIDEDCTRSGQFTPATTVTTSPTTAAAATSLTTRVVLPAGQQELDRVRLSLPKGLIAKIDGRQRCSIAAANAGTCAAASQIGVVTAKAGQGDVPGTFTGKVFLADVPASHPNALVGLAIELPILVGKVGATPIVDLGKVTSIGAITLRTDYGIDVDVAVPTEVRGIPAYLREFTLNVNEPGFMINPPTCTGNDVTGTLNAKQGGSAPVSSSLTVSGCAAAAFNPQVAFSATPDQPAAQSSLRTTLTLPATGDQSPLKTAVVRLPAGVSLSASASADGQPQLTGCTDAQFNKSSWANPTCPAASKVGSVEIQTPSVGAITGDAYIASTTPNGTISRLFLDASSTQFPGKVRIKVEGTINVNATSGETTATFDDLPPVGFTSFALSLRGAPNPVVSLPRTCGTFAGAGTLTPHAGAIAARTGSLTLNSACPPANQFGPNVSFDLAPNGAGDHGTLKTKITVPGGDQELRHVRVEMPEGLTAKLQGATRCTIVQANADACPALSKIGEADAKVGVSGAPFSQSGSIYLTEGRNGNIAGMAIILPAVVGPIDLGKVITIADVQLRSPDLALRIDADVPTRVKGVRLDIRELELEIGSSSDGQFYLLNPSSCGELTGTARFTSVDDRDASDDGAMTIAPGSCASQTFDPQLQFDAGTPRPNQASTFTTTITHANGPGAEAPFKSATVRLPDGVTMSASAGARGDLDGCTDAQFRQDDLAVASTCPAGSEIGTTRLETDLVGDLIGKAYLAPATSGNLARVFLETTATDVDNLTVRLVGKVNVDETTGVTEAVFDDVPAIPLTRFTVTFRGGDAPVLALPRTCGTVGGSARFESVNSVVQNRSASLVINDACPTPGTFEPTAALTRSNTEAGKTMDFGTTVQVPVGNEELRGLRMTLPKGLLGTIASIPACSLTDAQNGDCAPTSRVGSVSAKVGLHSAPFTVTGAAYLVRGDSNSIARLALVLPAKVGPVDLGEVITIAELRLRSDYGLDVFADQIPTQVKGVRLDLHEFSLSIDRDDFMVNPVSCDPANAVTTLRSKEGTSRDRTQGLTTTDCDDLRLDASLGFTAAPASPLSSSAVTTSIRATSPAGNALDAMKKVTVTMPENVSLSPSAGATGNLAECTAAQFNAGDISVDAACPAGSKVGTVELNSPMVGDLSGDVYLGAKSGGHFSGVFFQATGPEYPSLRVKIAGVLDVDENTGRLTATFDDLPQVQVSSIDLRLRGGDAPVLGLPRTCGSFGAAATVARHGGATTNASGALQLNEDCPDPNAFAPELGLGVSPSQAGASTALGTSIKVPARHQELRSMDVTMPKGLLGRLTVAAQCPVDAARAGNCGADSEVGDVSANVGVASAPFTVQGKAYMTQGWDGSIAGLMFKLPAKVGPIDLGDVVTMAKIELIGSDLQMKITAPEIPTRVKGIPLNISALNIVISRPGVVLNANNCGPQQAGASFGSAQGGSAQGTAGYQATGCEGLNWQPGMKTIFSGSQTDINVKGHPTLTTVIEQQEGQGTMKSAVVTLPEGIGADTKNVSARWCMEMSDALAGRCAPTAKLGDAEIVTSALPNPVRGDIIMVRVEGQTLPGLVIRVRDQGVAIDVLGQSRFDTKSGRVVASFDGLPDTPISKMTLTFNGGSSGVLVLTKPLCGVAGRVTDAALGAHHGASKNLTLPVDCGGKTSAGGTDGDGKGSAVAAATFSPSGSNAALTFALSNPNGIRKIVLKMPKGAIFQKKAWKQVKPTLTGAKAKIKVVNGERRMAISITPVASGDKVTKVKFKLPRKSVKINIKIRRVLSNKKTSKKKRQKLLAKLLKPSVTMIDNDGNATPVRIITRIGK